MVVLTDEQRDDLRDMLAQMSPACREAARRVPPMATVRAKPGRVFVIPAPGVDGTATSYFEPNLVMVTAPLAEQQVNYAGEVIAAGTMLRAQLHVEDLDVIDEGPVGAAVIAELCAELEDVA